MSSRQVGRVKWFNDAKGFGFITPNSGGKDVFVHYSAIRGSGRRLLLEGESVEFEVVPSEKGPSAADVQRFETE